MNQELIFNILCFVFLTLYALHYFFFNFKKESKVNLKKRSLNLKMNNKKSISIPNIVELSTPLYLPNTDIKIFDRKDIQKPWCNNWTNEKSNLKCFINKHLQRKCFWSCDRK